MRVIKTLVIGLGSTGTRICDAVAKRIEWELQKLDRAPWVRFLCIETNENQESALHHTGDFQVIKISAEEYQHIIQTPEHFDEKIHLTRWADMDTLRKLPGNEVSAGAGNIRMVGRLAFMYDTNYNVIKYAITKRLRELRELTEAKATEERGALSDGSNPAIEFAVGGEVRIFVVGTLCGGTCSGLTADFGYFLKTICTDTERVTGIFTLPRHDLAPAVEPQASRYKRNAYTSLLELNHYHLAERGNEPPIRYADGFQPDTRQFPYDLPYLMVPRQSGSDYEHELNRATADRIFLNIFVPETDPFAQAVDATIFDREHRAHVFCTVGLATVEFPAQQVIEACTKRLLAHAVREWQNRPMEAYVETRRLDQIGLTWDHLLDALLQMPHGDSLKRRLDQQKEEILRFARSNWKACEDSLDRLRAAFQQPGATSGAGDALSPGLIPSTFNQNRQAVGDGVLNKLRNLIQTQLLNYYDGPAPLQQLLKKAQDRLNEIQGVNPQSYDQQAGNCDRLLRNLRQYHRSRLLWFFGLRGAAINRLLPSLREALEAEVKSRLNFEAHRALQDQPVQAGLSEPGVLTRIRNQLKPVKKRVDSLMTRLTKLSNDLRRESDRLAREKPLINGICIFEPETAQGGTVRNEYERCLFEQANDPAAEWQQVREREAARIIGAWEQLPGALLPVRATNEEDWLMRDFNPNNPAENPIPETQQEKLEHEAAQPFLRLTNEDVLTRWHNPVNGNDPVSKAREAAQAAKPFLQVLRPLAEHGGRSPVAVRRIVLTPNSPYREDFLRAVNPALGGEVNNGASPDNYRCIILEEWYRFPLSGVPAVLGEDGLHRAECSDFPNFHTRKDVFWVGISDREIEAIRKAEEIVVVAVLLDILEPRGGALVLSWQAGGFGGATERRLPLSIRRASRSLAIASNDLDGNSLRGVLEALSDRIDHNRTSRDGNPHEQNQAFIQDINKKLNGNAANVIPDWQKDKAGLLLTRYCARNNDLYRAYVEVFPPDSSTVERLRKRAGDVKPRGGRYEADGLYCPECGGLVGTDEQDAARNGWRCYVDPDHYYGVGAREH